MTTEPTTFQARLATALGQPGATEDQIVSYSRALQDAVTRLVAAIHEVNRPAPLQARLAALLGQPGASEDELLGYVRASQDALAQLAVAVRDQHPDAARAAQLILTGSTDDGARP
jgi:ribose 1,5-bisphosphokinase PhnN